MSLSGIELNMGKIERQLRYGSVWTGRNQMSPLDGLVDAASRASPAQRRAWAREVVRLLKDPDIEVRTRAIAALNKLPANPKTVLNTLLDNPELFQGNGEGYPLWPEKMDDALWLWLSDKPQVTEAIRDRLSEQPLLVVFLSRNDHEWVLENAQEVVTRDMLGGVLLAFPEHKRADLLMALGPWDDAIDVLSESWWKRLEDAEPLRKIVALG
jgi:hypothetical protein